MILLLGLDALWRAARQVADLPAAVFDVVGHHRNAGRWGFLRGEG